MGKRILIENKTVGKGKMVLGWLIFIIGIFSMLGNWKVGLFLIVLGLLFVSVGKVQHSWWNN